MKKNILLILAALLFAGLFSVSCAVESYHPYQPVIRPPLEPLCEELKRQIEDDFGLDSFSGHPRARIIEYFGTYNGSVAVMLNEMFFHCRSYPGGDPHDRFNLSLRSRLVAGISFYYYFDVFIKIWREGQFYFLENAYDLGLLTKEDIESIAYFHNRYVKSRELRPFNAFDPSNLDLITHEVLCEEIKTQIKEDVLEATGRTIGTFRYYGTYGGAVAFSHAIAGQFVWGNVPAEIISDILFVYWDSTYVITVWKEGQFFSLREVYHTGILNRNDLKNVAFNFYNFRGGL